MSGWELTYWIVTATIIADLIRYGAKVAWPNVTGQIYSKIRRSRLRRGWEIHNGEWVRPTRCKKYLGDGNYCTRVPGHRGKCNYA